MPLALGSRLTSVVQEGRDCRKSKFDPSQLNCFFKVGTRLRIEVAGVGDPAAQVVIENSSDSNRDYKASFMLASQCIKVTPTSANKSFQDPVAQVAYVFISPRNGEVYEDPSLCGLSRR